MSDEFETARLASGDQAALIEYLRGARPRLLSYIQAQLGDALRAKIEPDDIAQEVWVEALRSCGQLELGDRDPFGWLCQLAERRIIAAHRRFFAAQKRAGGREVRLQNSPDDSRHAGIIDLLVASLTTASQAFSRDQRQHLLIQALARLPAEQRDALRLRYIDGLPSKEIATRIGKSDGAVRVMLSRALKELQELLGPQAAP
ncbi:MAG: sigma-70 family RNA polymerase sigma factor [Planctomycetaceae bacterium]|nr:sigma-70 family RNA polymerase sigma factor [Planctomycetaceae bacterium]